ncbi:hypothetical protein [Mycetohabitans rhizoxinica]|uniref:Uncharacterized protein n=1 Tax=Mycetohabitans rhizoxinica TaxID=412963 RepID=A0ABZ2Q2W5_9BURK
MSGRSGVPVNSEGAGSRNHLDEAATDRDDLMGSVAVDFFARRARPLRHPLRLVR